MTTPSSPTSPDRADGDAAKAIADAEAALAHQNSVTSQLDLQVVSAILNAHRTTVGGGEALDKLQDEIETAVETRSDLDTPAGARDFQRFLIGKLRDIREVAGTASLDATSKSALLAAWTSLYNASKSEPSKGHAAPQPQPAPTTPAAEPDSPLDSMLLDDPELAAAASPPTAPSSGGMSPVDAGMPAFGLPGGLALPSLPGGGIGRDSGALGDELFGDDPVADTSHRRDHYERDHHDEGDDDPADDEPPSDQPESPPPGPTTVTLPNGETVTAASPQLAAAIKAAAGGTPIAEAFQQQGIAIPPPGTAVSQPIDPSHVAPGDIGIFTDRHALALGRGKALLDGQIQHISTVTGPGFLGWEHPPTVPVNTDTPTPTRPATAVPTP